MLSAKCFRCHGAHRQEGELRLDRWDQALRQRLVGDGLGKGDLLRRVHSGDPVLRMPPEGQRLTAVQLALLRRWIEEDAIWSGHWAYELPRRHPVPPDKNSDWPANWIDRFILARLETEGLKPSNEADRVTLIRRLHFHMSPFKT